MQYQRQSGYVILFISIIVSTIGVIVALNTLLQAQQRTEVSVTSDNNLKSTLSVEQCSQQVLNKLRKNRYYHGGETLALDTDTSCHVFPITGQGNGERTFITQFSLQQDPYTFLDILDNPPQTQTLYQKTTLSSLSPEITIDSQGLIDTINEPYITRLSNNDPNRIKTPLLWLRADTITLSNYQSLEQWAGQEETITQSDTNFQPQYQTRQFRGRPSVVFDVDDEFPLPSDVETTLQDDTSPVIAVGIGSLANPNSNGYTPVVLSNSATDTSSWESTDTSWKDLGDITQMFPESSGTSTLNVEGDIVELIVYDTDSDLTTEEQNSLETYFTTKYNL